MAFRVSRSASDSDHDEQGHDPLLVYQGTPYHAPRSKMKGKELKLMHSFDATEDDDLDQVKFEGFKSDYLPA